MSTPTSSAVTTAVATGATGGGSGVFISYASHDDALVASLVAALEAAGIPFWLAPRKILAGDTYPSELAKAIRACAVFLLLLTEASDASPFVQAEVGVAFSSKRRILQVCVDAFEPMSEDLKLFLGLPQRLNVSASLNDDDLARIVDSLRRLLALPPVPLPKPPRAIVYDDWRFWIPAVAFYLLSLALFIAPFALYYDRAVLILALMAGVAIVTLTRHCNGLVLFTIGFAQPMAAILYDVYDTGGAAFLVFDSLEPVRTGFSVAVGGCLTSLALTEAGWRIFSWSDWAAWLWPRRRARWTGWLERVLRVGLLGMTVSATLWKLTR
jgi:hypothetical protein